MKKLSLLLFATIALANVNAQKIPNVQQRSVAAPAGVKIDGKATEWGKFEANNSTTELLYTIANDDKKLYLVAQTSISEVYNRISNGGIKLIIQKNGKKSEDGAAVVKFPYQERPGELSFNTGISRFTITGSSMTVTKEPEVKPTSVEQADSLMKVNNSKLTKNLKWIYTKGITGIDSLIPVYNDKGIEAAAAFDNKKVYTFEIAIDLKLLGLTAANAEKFSYHLVVNGTPNKMGTMGAPTITTVASAGSPAGASDMVRSLNESLSSSMAPRYATTDFWGEYTLAK